MPFMSNQKDRPKRMIILDIKEGLKARGVNTSDIGDLHKISSASLEKLNEGLTTRPLVSRDTTR